MSTVTIRVSEETHLLLRSLADERQQQIGDLVATAVKRFDEQAFWDEVEAGYAALRADPEGSAAFDAEVAEWDVTLNDGLEDDPWVE